MKDHSATIFQALEKLKENDVPAAIEILDAALLDDLQPVMGRKNFEAKNALD
jgi:hypothetical protein